MKNTLNKTFWQLLTIYCLMILTISLGLFWKYTLQFQIFAVIIALIGIFSLSSNENKEEKTKINSKLHYALLFLGLAIILILRIIPYIGNSIPLGYDPGIYKYGIEHGLEQKQNWILQGGLEPGFLYLMSFLKILFSTQTVLTYLLIFVCLILGISIYFLVKIYSDKKTALIALLLYSFSIIQFKTFWYMYYKNILGMILLLFSLYFLKKSESDKKFLIRFILLGGLIGSVHRPTFYIFGLSYFIFAITSPYKDKRYNWKLLQKNILIGLGIIAVAGIFYIGKFSQAITIMFDPVLQGFLAPGEAAGTFINFFTYQFSSLFYLPLALLGLFYFLKKRELNILAIWAILNFCIVYFQFFFFNRFIIFLDIIMLIMASFGFSLILEQKKKLGTLLLIILLASAGITALHEAQNSKPLIDNNELKTIEYLNNTESNALVMSTSSNYSPWIQGYSQRRTIAPGLFDYDNHTKEEWITFWTTTNISEVNSFMSQYQKPLYIFIGQQQKDNLAQFNESGCFSKFYELNKNRIYQYNC